MQKRLVAAALFLAVAAQPMYAGFSDVARAIDSRRGVNRVWIPFLGLARFAVWVVQPKGVHDFQLATFEGAGNFDARELQQILHTKIGPGYQPLVRTWSKRSRDWSFIYVKPAQNSKRLELVVLSRDGEDTVLVRVEVDAEIVARELGDEPGGVIRLTRK